VVRGLISTWMPQVAEEESRNEAARGGGRVPELRQDVGELGDRGAAVVDLALVQHLPARVDDADLMLLRRPVDADEVPELLALQVHLGVVH